MAAKRVFFFKVKSLFFKLLLLHWFNSLNVDDISGVEILWPDSIQVRKNKKKKDIVALCARPEELDNSRRKIAVTKIKRTV